jgi:hypothetical protein
VRPQRRSIVLIIVETAARRRSVCRCGAPSIKPLGRISEPNPPLRRCAVSTLRRNRNELGETSAVGVNVNSLQNSDAESDRRSIEALCRQIRAYLFETGRLEHEPGEGTTVEGVGLVGAASGRTLPCVPPMKSGAREARCLDPTPTLSFPGPIIRLSGWHSDRGWLSRSNSDVRGRRKTKVLQWPPTAA